MGWFFRTEVDEILHRLSTINVGVTGTGREVRNLKELIMSAQADIDRLKRIVSENTSVTNSVVTLIQGLSQQIRENADNPEEIRAIADQVDADYRKLAEAVAANTPSQPEPTPTPEPAPETPTEETPPTGEGEGGETFQGRRRSR